MQGILNLDKTMLLWINSHHNVFLDVILKPISLSGEVGAIWILLFLGMMIFGKSDHRKAALTFMVTIIIVDRLIGPLFGGMFFRERPYAVLEGIRQWGIRWGGGSFPSGHAMCVWIPAIVLGAKWRRLALPLVIFAILTCYSRPYFGMHYPLDVLVGSLIGIAAGFIAVGICRLITIIKHPNPTNQLTESSNI